MARFKSIFYKTENKNETNNQILIQSSNLIKKSITDWTKELFTHTHTHTNLRST